MLCLILQILKIKKLLISHKIFTEPELYSRYEIKLENYVKTLHIESCTMAEIIQKDLIPLSAPIWNRLLTQPV